VAALGLRDIVKSYGKNRVLSDITLDVEDGEFCVLLGPSGCGKSTLLGIIAGLISQDSGSVLFNHRPVDRLTPRERDVAMVFQNYALYPHMTVAQNLSFGLRMRRIDKETIRRQIVETAGLLGIDGLLDRKPKDLSGGQQQRVAMGRALVRRPGLFLLDEPLSNLDARLRAKVRLELKDLHRQIRGTVVYVTHDQVEAMTLGDRVVVMREGSLCQVGTPREIYSRPADTFVARFIGSPEMNLLSGRVHRDHRGAVFNGDGFRIDLEDMDRGIEGGELQIGIRPEDVEIEKDAASDLKGRAEIISDVGSEKHVHARLGKVQINLIVPKGTTLQIGDDIPLAFPTGRLHFFKDGKRASP
jgi:multiple sugar transport system ATP-binding protein